MRALIAIASLLALSMPLQCWGDCECDAICPAAGVFACVGLALLAGAAIHILASIAWELNLLSR